MRIDRRNDKESKNGLAPLVFVISHKGEEYKIPSGEKCKQWDQDAQAVSAKVTGGARINDQLRKGAIVLQYILDNVKFNINHIRKLYKLYLSDKEKYFKDTESLIETSPVEYDTSEFERIWTSKQKGQFASMSDKQKQFYLLIEGIIKEHRKEWSPGYKKRFRTIHTKFFQFDPEFTIDRLTVTWWREFVAFCFEELENVNNTVNADSKVIQKIVEELQKKRYKFEDLEDIDWKYIEPEMSSLSWDKVLRIQDLDLSELPGTTQDSQILWLLGAFTGRRWEEIETVDKKNFYQDNKGRWRYRSTAKGLKPVDLPLLPEAINLLVGINFKVPRLSQQTVNRDIKEIAKRAGISSPVLRTSIRGKEVIEERVSEYTTVHFHTGRHSYAEHIVDLAAGKPHYEKFVSFMLGHASFQTTWKYINRRKSSNDQMFDDLFNEKAL